MIVPNLNAPLVNKLLKTIPPWNSFFQQFTQKAPAVNDISVGISPFEFTASSPGNMYVTGGTISAISVTRGPVTIVIDPTTQVIPLGIGDVLSVTYSVLPTLQFLANY